MPDGSLEPVRCGASNRCGYCAMFAALTAAVMIKLDAEIECPTVGLTTTTRRPSFTLAELRRAEEYLWRWIRRRHFPQARYCGFLEWTTGRGSGAGGVRRPHVHHLVKGVPRGHELLEVVDVVRSRKSPGGWREVTLLELLVGEVWRRITGDAFVVEARELRTPAGAIAYLTLHHHKREQAAPPGMTHVRRLRPSRQSRHRPGYYELPSAELRELADRTTADARVLAAARKVVATELYGEAEIDADEELSRALLDALAPEERQLDLEHGELEARRRVREHVPRSRRGQDAADAERAELVQRTVAALRRIREDEPRELVRVFERDAIDPETGEVVSVATRVLGPVDARGRDVPEWVREMRGIAPSDEVQLRLSLPRFAFVDERLSVDLEAPWEANWNLTAMEQRSYARDLLDRGLVFA
jgi:hypothetical protein